MPTGHPSDRHLLADTYQLLETIDEARGVFKAFDRRHRRIVTVRIFSASSATGGETRDALRRELRILRRLKHPNVVAAIDSGEDRGVPFVVMEYAEGDELEQVVRHRGPLPSAQAIDAIIQAARGLEAAHAHGIVHGDLRPSNLLLDRAGMVRVLGLGSTTASRERADTGPDPRRVDYMAPESADGSPTPDARGDIYSLGCTLYFLLAGREPFVGETVADRLRAHRERPAPSICVLRPEVSTAVEAAYRRMTAKRPEDRPASMAEVVGILESSRESLLNSSSPEPAAPASSRRRRSLAPGVARDPEAVARGGDVEGLAIGPEFSLEGLGMDVRPLSPPSASHRPAIGLRSAGSGRAARRGSPRRLAVVIAILAAAAILVVAASRFARFSDEVGPRPAAIVDRKAEVPPPRPERNAKIEWVSRTIFDGGSPRGWMLTNRKPLPRKHVQPDGLNPHGTGSYMVVYEQKLGDFVLDFDYKLGRGCRTGIFLRVGDLDNPVQSGLAVALADAAGTDDQSSGAFKNLAGPSQNAQHAGGEWNHMTISALGPAVTVSINGVQINRIRLEEWNVPGKRPDGTRHRLDGVAIARLPRIGFLGIQDLVGDCWFRDIVVKTAAGP